MNVLLVEDNPEVSLITVEYLNELGHQVLAVGDAESAMQQVGEQNFDAVMTDVSLPGMSGIDFVKKLMQTTPGIPVIICSGYGILSVESLVGVGHQRVLVLPKPYDLPTLEKTLAEAAALKVS